MLMFTIILYVYTIHVVLICYPGMALLRDHNNIIMLFTLCYLLYFIVCTLIILFTDRLYNYLIRDPYYKLRFRPPNDSFATLYYARMMQQMHTTSWYSVRNNNSY